MRLFTVSGIRKVFNLLREKVMIRQKIFNGIFLAILSLVLISCSPTEENLVNIDPSYMNQQILLKKAGVLNTFKIDDPIFLELYYNTNNVIVFPNNYGLKIYYKADNEWIEVAEKPTQRFPDGEVIFSPEKQMAFAESVVVAPSLLDKTRKYYLRIYVIGNMKVDADTVQVSAFTDIELVP